VNTIVDNRAETALSRHGNDSAGRLDTPRMSSGRNQGWAVVHTHPQAERWATSNITRLGYRTFLPLYAVLVRDPVLHTRTRTAMRPLFPRYLFVHLEDGTPWVPIRYAPGVSDLLMADGKPAHAPEAAISALEATVASRRTLMAPGPVWAAGDASRVVLGPFQGMDAVVIAAGRKTARIALVMLGALREVTVRCNALATREQ
jgi:transcriptional antiterminator RfaH